MYVPDGRRIKAATSVFEGRYADAVFTAYCSVLDLECDEARSQGWASAGAKEPVLALKRQPYGAPRIHLRPHLILRRRTTVAVTCQTIC